MARMSSLQLAKRALVTLLLAFARLYVVPGLGISHDSSDPDVEKAFKKIVRKVHPDKGGSVRDTQKLNSARELWDKDRIRRKKTKKGFVWFQNAWGYDLQSDAAAIQKILPFWGEGVFEIADEYCFCMCSSIV